MKFFNVKTAIAAVCVVAAGFGGMKAYNNANQSESEMLLAENVEALSSGDECNWTLIDWAITRTCPFPKNTRWCDFSISCNGHYHSGTLLGYSRNGQ